MVLRAEEYAQRLVADEEVNQGKYWLMGKKGYWPTFMTEEDYWALERFGFDLGLTELQGL